MCYLVCARTEGCAKQGPCARKEGVCKLECTCQEGGVCKAGHVCEEGGLCKVGCVCKEGGLCKVGRVCKDPQPPRSQISELYITGLTAGSIHQDGWNLGGGELWGAAPWKG